jgi:tripartite-type tricarboxylate transporter receptor subunit TctC
MQRKRASRALGAVLSGAALSVCLLTLASESSRAQHAEPFYKGKTINLLVATVPGGVNDLTARLISRHLGKHIPGDPIIIVQNLQSSGLVLINRVYNAEKDGLTIGIVERGAPQVAIMGDPNARFDPLKITWLGSVSSYANDAYTLSVNAGFYAKTVDDLRTKDRPSAKIGSTGAGATNGIFTNIARDVLKLNIQHVRGYRGAADVFLAQQRGELDGQVVGLASMKVGQPALWQAGAFRPLIMFGRTTRVAEFPDVPTGRELTKDPEALRLLDFAEAPFFMALPLIAPPDLPAERAAALRHGFMAMAKDPAFIAEAEKMNLDLSPIDGEAVRKVVADMAQTPADVIAQFKEIAGAKQ